MRSSHTGLAILTLIVLALLVLSLGTAAELQPRAAPQPTVSRGDEVARIQARLREVERELLARDVSHLSAAQRAARARNIRILRRYRKRGIFPHNHGHPGERVPYFVDRHGTLCAVAYLIAHSGREELVARIAASRNNATVRELADSPALPDWLESAGLTLEEAARIQPAYDCCIIEPPQLSDDAEIEDGYALASALANGLGGAAIVLNLPVGRADGGEWWRGGLGVAAGAFGMALGVPALDDDGAARWLGALNTAIGAASAALGLRTLWTAPPERTASTVTESPPETPRPGLSLTISPWVPAEGAGGAGIAFGLHF